MSHNMETIVTALVQAGPTGVFAVFAWWLSKENRGEREKKDSIWMEFLENRNGKTEKFMQENTSALIKVHESLNEIKHGIKK